MTMATAATSAETWKENYPIYKDISTTFQAEEVQKKPASQSSHTSHVSPTLKVKQALSSRKVKPSPETKKKKVVEPSSKKKGKETKTKEKQHKDKKGKTIEPVENETKPVVTSDEKQTTPRKEKTKDKSPRKDKTKAKSNGEVTPRREKTKQKSGEAEPTATKSNGEATSKKEKTKDKSTGEVESSNEDGKTQNNTNEKHRTTQNILLSSGDVQSTSSEDNKKTGALTPRRQITVQSAPPDKRGTVTPELSRSVSAESRVKVLPRQRSINIAFVDKEVQVSSLRGNESTGRHIPRNTQTISTQTSATMFLLSERSTSINQPVKTVTKNLIATPSNANTKLISSAAHLPVPPTPEGPRFNQTGTQLTYTHPGVQNETFKNLHVMQTRGELCDVLIRVGDIDFKAHKVVLSAACPYFAALFKDIKTIRIDRLMLQGLSAHAVASMIGYFYLSKLIVDVEDVEELIDAAYYFKTQEVIQLCTDYLELNLNINNCINFYKLSVKYNIEGLRAKTFHYICWNFNSIVQDLRFFEISVETLLEIISSNSVKVKSENEVYKAVWDWYRYNMEDRKCHLPKMTMYIHFEAMDEEFLEGTVKNEMYLESALCRKKVDDALIRIKHKIDEKDRTLDNFRQASDNIYVFSTSSNTCDILDIKTCKFSSAQELQLPNSIDQNYHVTIKAGKCLYTLSKSKVIMFNPETMNWDVIADGVPIADTGICSNKSSIYVLGGKVDGKIGWELHLKQRKWEQMPEMHQDRRSPAVSVMGNTKPRIFVAGGYSLSISNVLDTMEFYTAADKTWRQIKNNMLQPRFQAAMIISNDKVFVVGGRCMEKTINNTEYYDRATSKWHTCKGTLGEEKTNCNVVEYEGKIYCIGGVGNNTVELLHTDGKTMEWKNIGKLENIMVASSSVVYQPV